MDGRRWSGFYFITDSGLTTRGVRADVEAALSGGAALVQYREKDRTYDERLAEARELARLCRAAGVPLIVNDGIALARDAGAQGVHLGQSDAPPCEARAALGPRAIVGVSVGSPEEALTAGHAGADYVAASPVFATTTKLDAGPGIGLGGLRAIRTATGLPLAAIGGVTLESIPDVAAAGADLVCAISASLKGGDVAANVRALREAMGHC
ncbi:MAG: thiamine phosphate synthase [Planctomycetota bacterium]|jgi:thiamine-phosphate pyrophosphorylase